MIVSKNKKCVKCGRDDLPHFSHKMCFYCANIEYGKKNSAKTKKDRNTTKTKKTIEDIEKESNDLKVYYDFHIKNIEKSNVICENCGKPLKKFLLHSNIAHILPKSKYKSISNNLNNYLYLCSGKDETGNDCHYDFDFKGKEVRTNMKVFKEIAIQRYNEYLKDVVVEFGSLRAEFDNK